MPSNSDAELEVIRAILAELACVPADARGRIVYYVLQRTTRPELSEEPLYPLPAVGE